MLRSTLYHCSVIVTLFLVCSCSKSSNEQIEIESTSEQAPITGDPVEKNAPNSNYHPAFEGQSRIGSMQTTTPISAEVISQSLSNPWGIAPLPDGRLLITQKTGNMRIASTDGTLSNPITGIPSVNSIGQGGLLGLCVDPNFSSNRMIYWVFSENVSGGTVTSVAKGKLANNEATIENVSVIFRANPSFNGSAHYGGRILFDKTGHLIISTGERSDLSTRPLAQSVTGALGKILRITTNGSPAPGNPNFQESGAIAELYSIGHRNPQGIAIHPINGDLWQSEHGPLGGDEVNRVEAGKNYGWPIISYGLEYNGQAIGNGITQKEGLEQPVYYWDPAISPSGITFYAGNRIPEWENNLFLGALSGQHIVRLVIDANHRVIGEERLLESENQRFRDIAQGLDKALYAITDSGRLYRIDKVE